MSFTFIREAPAMPIAARIDEFGKPAWIALMILGFVWWWPLGIAILAFMIGSGRMGCWNHNGMGRWQSKVDSHEQWYQLVGNSSALKRQSRFRRISRRHVAQT